MIRVNPEGKNAWFDKVIRGSGIGNEIPRSRVRGQFNKRSNALFLGTRFFRKYSRNLY